MEISLTHKAAIVTGAGRGIGRAIAQNLARSGASVLLTDIDESALAEAEAALGAASGGAKLATIAGDITNAQFPEAVVQKALKAFGSIDMIVNNAGYTWDSVIQKTTDEQFQAMLDIHVVAPFRLLRAAAPWLRETAKTEIEAGKTVMRKVVNITSISGLGGNAGQSGYSSGKAAVVGLTKTVAKEWGRYNVTVNAVAFGIIDTRLTRPMESAETNIAIGDRQVRVGMQAQCANKWNVRFRWVEWVRRKTQPTLCCFSVRRYRITSRARFWCAVGAFASDPLPGNRYNVG